MPELPPGTVTLLFTDIEGSTRLWEQYPKAMRDALVGHHDDFEEYAQPWTVLGLVPQNHGGELLVRHDALLRHVIEAHSGRVFKTVGDQFCAAFARAPTALAAALEAQRALQAQPWGHEQGGAGAVHLRVRMALHTGVAEERDGDYFGTTLTCVARLLEAGHGGQVLLSQASQAQVCDHLPEGTSLRNLGQYRLRELRQLERIFQLVTPDLPADFPPLTTLDTLTRQLAGYLAMPIFIVDPQGALIFYNEPAERILGRRYAETGDVLPQDWAILIDPGQEEEAPLAADAMPLLVALTERRPAHRSFWIRGMDSVIRHVGVTAIPIIDELARFLGAMAILWEIGDEGAYAGNTQRP